MAESEPPAREHEPDHVADQRAGACIWSSDERAAERPQAEQGDSGGGDSERDRNDEDEHHEGDDRVGERQQKASEYQPDEVEKKPHVRRLYSAVARPGAAHREAAGLECDSRHLQRMSTRPGCRPGVIDVMLASGSASLSAASAILTAALNVDASRSKMALWVPPSLLYVAASSGAASRNWLLCSSIASSVASARRSTPSIT